MQKADYSHVSISPLIDWLARLSRPNRRFPKRGYTKPLYNRVKAKMKRKAQSKARRITALHLTR